MLFYTGVGSRKTPEPVLGEMVRLAEWLRACGYTLRSGHAPGADSAFEAGACDDAHIYLPWPAFNGSTQFRPRTRPTFDAYKMAATIHPAWDRLSGGARALHARNCHQVLGDDLCTPSRFLVCWTPDGCEHEAQRTRDTGGTGTAIVLACRHGIPVVSMRSPDWQDRVNALVAQ